jgi:hypothetical protein
VSVTAGLSLYLLFLSVTAGGKEGTRLRREVKKLNVTSHQKLRIIVAGVTREVAWQELVESRAKEGRGGGSEGIYMGRE